MARIKWSEAGSRFFEAGVDRGVLYPADKEGVAWDGLVSVDEKPIGGSSVGYYIDGLMHFNDFTLEEYSSTLTAYTYPEEFSLISGEEHSSTGIIYEQQSHQEFGLCYRTFVGSDVDVEMKHYKLHLIYNVSSGSTTQTHSSFSSSIDPTLFSWNLTARPERLPARKPTAKIVLDSRYADPAKLSSLEEILYGTLNKSPRLPSMDEVVDIFDDWGTLMIERDVIDGLSPITYEFKSKDLKGDNRLGLFKAPKGTRLHESVISGLYHLE